MRLINFYIVFTQVTLFTLLSIVHELFDYSVKEYTKALTMNTCFKL